jgi:hypothetical protein
VKENEKFRNQKLITAPIKKRTPLSRSPFASLNQATLRLERKLQFNGYCPAEFVFYAFNGTVRESVAVGNALETYADESV